MKYTFLFFLLSLFATNLAAAPITYVVVADYQGGISVSGGVIVDTTTSRILNAQLSVSGPSTGFHNFFANGAVIFNVIQTNFWAPNVPRPLGQLFEAILPAGSDPSAADARAQLQLLSIILDPLLPTALSSTCCTNFSQIGIVGASGNIYSSVTGGAVLPVPNTPAAIPEPSSYSFLALGLASLAFRLRRSRS